MVDARCSFGIHLDMNPGHVGFEFYDVAPRGQLGSLDHPLRAESEAEGTIPDVPPRFPRAADGSRHGQHVVPGTYSDKRVTFSTLHRDRCSRVHASNWAHLPSLVKGYGTPTVSLSRGTR